MGPKNMAGGFAGAGNSTANGVGYGQGLAGPPFSGHGGMIPPQGMMSAGFDPLCMGRGGGYGVFPSLGFPSMFPSFTAINLIGLTGVAPHVNPGFFGRGMAPNGMGMMVSYGMDGPDPEMCREKERGSKLERPGNSDRKYHEEREQHWDSSERENRESRHRDDKDSYRGHQQRALTQVMRMIGTEGSLLQDPTAPLYMQHEGRRIQLNNEVDAPLVSVKMDSVSVRGLLPESLKDLGIHDACCCVNYDVYLRNNGSRIAAMLWKGLAYDVLAQSCIFVSYVLLYFLVASLSLRSALCRRMFDLIKDSVSYGNCASDAGKNRSMIDGITIYDCLATLSDS
ncbi:hypothetical protein POTOM_061096 [Populus tomentosa]|uniref:Uncharacterized protein n=1 Tax=Populus tomentosa TaxID=118781 RepID=A0A8X8BZY1_POPTO|nr:hypothetical protein POTOM_061096 [Populus tomentosa]